LFNCTLVSKYHVKSSNNLRLIVIGIGKEESGYESQYGKCGQRLDTDTIDKLVALNANATPREEDREPDLLIWWTTRQ
jgi:hypothetical protein